MIEYIIYGTTRTGVKHPVEHGMTTWCVQHAIDAYKAKYPEVVHICLDVALDDTKLIGGR